MPNHVTRALALLSLAFACAAPDATHPLAPTRPLATTPREAWKPTEVALTTRWGRQVRPENAWREYPRPTMVRERWLNLNGLWEFAIDAGEERPSAFQGEILVPFPLESSLSGVGRRLARGERLWYRRTFDLPREWSGERVLLHFGAVDWHALVLLNGDEVGSHLGGYDPFTLDITDALQTGENELVVAVLDPTDAGGQPRGKQVSKPEGIWYTPSSGIWQTVWLEPVPQTFVRGAVVRADSQGDLVVGIEAQGGAAEQMRIELSSADGVRVASASGPVGVQRLRVASPRVWSPDDPYLYDLRVTLFDRAGVALDEIQSYCGFRDIAVARDEHGAPRLLLNGRALFQFGPLDQGFWPDGLYTAPSLDALRFDIEAVRRMGGNMLRKHVKVEPELFYTLCDRLGVLVWQDMPSGNADQSPEWRENFERELRELVRDRGHHPSIVMWVPFNEGWGQHETERITALVEQLDPSRLVDDASGWTDAGVGDVIDIHAYPGPAMAALEARRASVLGEFGGLGLPLEGHTWLAQDNWGYRSYASREELTAAYLALVEQLPLLIGQGLCAAVYTQTTDVEIEVNGWLTYDREQWKIDPERALPATRKLYEPPPRSKELLKHAGNGGAAEWSFTFDAPSPAWSALEFDASAWKRGLSGFGTTGTPGAFVGTEWSASEIWLRREFELASPPSGELRLWLHHDEAAEVYLNGVLAAKVAGYTTNYVLLELSPEARAVLHAGRNVLAIHCTQTTGGQYIDAGLALLE